MANPRRRIKLGHNDQAKPSFTLTLDLFRLLQYLILCHREDGVVKLPHGLFAHTGHPSTLNRLPYNLLSQIHEPLSSGYDTLAYIKCEYDDRHLPERGAMISKLEGRMVEKLDFGNTEA